MRRAIVAALLVLGACIAAPAGAVATGTPPGQGVHFVYLVRHGAHDRDNSVSEITANALNKLGREQAKRIGVRLASLHLPFRALVTSDFLRARQTADAIGARLHMAPTPDSLLRECTPTPEHPEYTTYHSPEDVAACVATLESVARKYLTPTPDADTWDVLVCHGNVIRWLTLKSLGADVHRWYDPDIANASLTVIEVRPDGSYRLATFNDTGHLPAAMQTWAGRGGGWTGARRRTAIDVERK